MGEFRINDRVYHCPVELTLGIIGGKWKALIVWHLRDVPQRYGELKRALPGITHKMLTQQLRELEQDGILHRQVYQVVPPRVEYSLTERGQQMQPILEAMQQWGLVYKVATRLQEAS